MPLLIVESPNKIKKIQKYLGPNFTVTASAGHIRDLPEDEIGYSIEGQSVKATFVNSSDQRKAPVLAKLKSLAKASDEVYLATDPDREGEAISWHLMAFLGKSKKYKRVTFTEITEKAILKALDAPRNVDQNLVNAYLARRIMDRSIGYIVSPVLGKKLGKGYSAGRVQSVLVRMLLELETEIEKFKESLYWSLRVQLSKRELGPENFVVELKRYGGKKLGYEESPEIFWIKNSEMLQSLKKEFSAGKFMIKSIEKKPCRGKPHPPFVTSSLLRKCSNLFHWSVEDGMALCQKLFEMGKITYHRSDSTSVSDDAAAMAKKYILEKYDQRYYPKQAHSFGKVEGSQEAHECIRPTSLEDGELDEIRESGDERLLKLYDLIKTQFITSQMAFEDYFSLKCTVINGQGEFEASGKIVAFDGWTRYKLQDEIEENKDEEQNTIFQKWVHDGCVLDLDGYQDLSKKTTPPARFTEATLIKKMEVTGIGRPSTYATSIKTIKDKEYVELRKGKYFVTEKGKTLVQTLLKIFVNSWMEISFTKDMEEDLDLVTNAKKDWNSLVIKFDNILRNDLDQNDGLFEDKREDQIQLDEICPDCGKNLCERKGQFGPFICCTQYPSCKYKKHKKEELLSNDCPQCKSKLVRRNGKKGEFIGCSNYPKCKYIQSS